MDIDTRVASNSPDLLDASGRDLSDQSRTPEAWAQMYRAQLRVSGVHATAPGFVILPLHEMAAANVPEPLGIRMLDELISRAAPVPVLALAQRYTFLAMFDRFPDAGLMERLAAHGLSVSPHRSNVILPTCWEPPSRGSVHWIRPPRPDELWPSLSEVLDSANAVVGVDKRQGSYPPSESG
ncbi:hypothetical protein AB0C34_27915 [Nocardia sp. NPDC049220]|uniref:hypothetical protein n=1 Tax=Nocardia sp. NPDC049220 TaxID=3155273 RepID=UPI0033D43F4E